MTAEEIKAALKARKASQAPGPRGPSMEDEMKYATIDTTTLTVWGIGSTAEESAADARDNLAYAGIDQAREFGTHTPVSGQETMECTDAVFDEVEAWGGEFDNSPGEEWTIYTRADGSKLLKMVHE